MGLHVEWVTGRSILFYLSILVELDAQRWMGSGGAAPQWLMFLPFVATIAVSCVLARLLVSFGRPFPVPTLLKIALTVGSVFCLTVLASDVRLLTRQSANYPMTDGWQRNLILDTPRNSDRKEPQDIVLFIIESLRPDAITQQTMPFVHGLAESGFQLPNHFSGANSSLPGLYSLLNGSPAIDVKSNLV